jgi:choline dehydrogenase-like flavoprotein
MRGPDLDAEFIIVGSGPAGVSAAVPLIAAGRRVLMIDGGGEPLPSPQLPGPPSMRDMLGERLEALRADDGLSPKLRTPAARRIIESFQQSAGLAADNFFAAGALARGGLSRVWGGFVSELDQHDLAGWPLKAADLRASYRAVTERIGVSGATDDDMARFYGSSGPIQPAPPLGALAAALYERYRGAAPIADFALGRARNALLTVDRADRLACDLSLSCLWGCARGAIYDARHDLAALARSPSFRLIGDAVATRIVADDGGWRVLIEDGGSFRAPRVLLAAGTLGTLRLVVPLLPDHAPAALRLLSSPVQVMPLLVARRLGRPMPQRGYTLAQLGYALRSARGPADYVTGGLYEVAALPPSSFVARLPLGRRAGTELFRALASALMVATTYFPGRDSANEVRWRREGDDARIAIRGGFGPDFGARSRAARRRLARIFRRLGAWPLPGAAIARPGTDAHFGGLFPMGLVAPHGTSRDGELNVARGVFVIDGAAHPTVPAKFNTLTIMANADRIGRHLAGLDP